MRVTTTAAAGLGVAMLLFLAAACTQPAVSEGDDSTEEAPPIQESDLGVTVEARAFFDAPDTAIWTEDIPVSELKQFVEAAYAAGAPEVFFAGVDTIGERRVSAWLVVKLPVEAASRSRVFEVFNKILTEYYGESEKERGQRFIGLSLD